MNKKPPDQFSAEVTQKRFEAALRGARIAGHKPMTDMRAGKAKPSRGKSPGARKTKLRTKKDHAQSRL
jgi:hypothetical protein